jgi:cystinosin
MNFDFVGMNLTGFLLYSMYNTYGYFVNQESTGRVDLNDIIFCYHALFATLLTVTQIMCFPFKNNKIHNPTLILLLFMWGTIIVYATLTLQLEVISPEPRLSVISFMGYYKLAISTLKYIPQFYWNYKRKSTKGWSIFNILMDLTGGLFSFLQMAVEALYGLHVEINVVKLVLGIMVVFYDIGFIIQHYCLYKGNEPKEAQRPPKDELM